MSKQTIRPYAMMIYGLQDDFISVLKPRSSESKGQITQPQIILKNDGTQELTFSIPMYYNDEITNERMLNPMWGISRDNEYLSNWRKIKVIFYPDATQEDIYEFVIDSKEDVHDKGELRCEIHGKGLAQHELGGIGYKLHLTQDDFLVEYEEWAENPETTDPEPVMNINYWLDKVFPSTSAWRYEIQMNWSDYDGILDEAQRINGARESNKIYEDPYISDWDSNLVPVAMEEYKEKYRAINCTDSNCYNITQDIAEAFGVYCKYEYDYDSNYKIIGRKVVFYNSFFSENEGYTDINYPSHTNSITRTIESADIVTKLYVTDIEDADIANGYISISDVSANPLLEDYILNFDYAKKIGAITKEQENAIDSFSKTISTINKQLVQSSSTLEDYDNQIFDLQIKLANAQDSAKGAQEQAEDAQRKIQSLLGDTRILSYTSSAPQVGILVDDTDSTKKVRLTGQGILHDEDHDIKVYSTYSAGSVSGEITGISYREDNGLAYAVGIPNSYSGTVYITYDYSPIIKYEEVYNNYIKVKAQAEEEFQDAQQKLSSIQEAKTDLLNYYNSLLDEKNTQKQWFERLMGAAIREGNWQDDNYKDYGSKKTANLTISQSPAAGDPCFIWDSDLFDGEQKNYYSSGVPASDIYYGAILLNSTKLEAIKDKLNELSFIYEVSEQGTSGTLVHTINLVSNSSFGFVKNGNTIYPIILFTNTDAYNAYEIYKQQDRVINEFLGLVNTIIDAEGNVTTEYESIIDDITPSRGSSSYVTVFPRIQIATMNLKTKDELFTLKYNDEILNKYESYSILTKNKMYYITIKPLVLFGSGATWCSGGINLKYEISNAAISLYLDALQVMKTNAFPQVSYNITLSKVPDDILKTLYNQLNRLVHINDPQLFLDNVSGYVSEVTLNLDAPWTDNITIQDYKTKFEDLFTSITAATAQIRTNGAAYNTAAAAFSVNGPGVTINEATLQTTLNNFNFEYSFQNGTLTINEKDGIWGTQDTDGDGVTDAVIAFRGGGIFCANQKDVGGNWIWNSAITPAGINANLITAGQLDTNNVRIFAGNDLALQLNSGGLFAYDKKSDGTYGYDLDTYVVHNKDGLFFHEDDIDKVEISWNGLKLRNSNGDDTFYLDNNGNLIVNHAHIFDAQIDGLTVGEITQGQRGVKINNLSGDTYKYPAEATEPTNPELLYEMIFNFVTQQSLSAYYRYDIEDDWTQIDLTLTTSPIIYNSSLKTLTIKNIILPSSYSIGFIRIVSHCIIDATSELKDYENILTIYNDKDGAGGGTNTNTVIITSTNGSFFKNNTGSTTLAVKVFSSEGVDITDTIAASNFVWTKTLNNGVVDPTFEHTGKTLYVTAQNVDQQATYSCKVTY